MYRMIIIAQGMRGMEANKLIDNCHVVRKMECVKVGECSCMVKRFLVVQEDFCVELCFG